jgi:hypothetical protein
MTQQWIVPDAVFDGARLHRDMAVLTVADQKLR